MTEDHSPKMSSRLQEGKDYYFDSDGFMVFTAEYLTRRGHCCESGCRHCPYGFKAPRPKSDTKITD